MLWRFRANQGSVSCCVVKGDKLSCSSLPSAPGQKGVICGAWGSFLFLHFYSFPGFLLVLGPPQKCPQGTESVTQPFPKQRPGASQGPQGGNGGAKLMWAKATLGLVRPMLMSAHYAANSVPIPCPAATTGVKPPKPCPPCRSDPAFTPLPHKGGTCPCGIGPD